MDTSFAASPAFTATLLRTIAVAVLATEILLVWAGRRRRPAPLAHLPAPREAPLGRLMWVATPALVLVLFSLWSAASVAPAPGAAPEGALALVNEQR